MNKRILFFWPNTSNRGRITLSIPILTAIAKQRGWETSYFDTSFYQKEDDSCKDREKTGTFKPVQSEVKLKPFEQAATDLQYIIDKFQPDVIAITGMTNDFQYMMKSVSKVKISSRPILIFGGTHALHSTGEILDTSVSLSCFGQGEYILPKILAKIEDGENLENIPGTSYISLKKRKVVIHPVAPALSAEELWKIDPDYSFYGHRYYSYPFDGKMVNMFWLEVGRGCPFGCTYCEAPQMRNLYKGKGKWQSI